MEYAESRIDNWKDVSKLRGKQFLRIDLVCTDFSQVASFDQPLLNRDRLKALWTVYRTPFDVSHMS